MPDYKLIIFDFDGTLCCSKAAVSESLQVAYQNLHQPIPDVQIIDKLLAQGTRIKALIKTLSPEATPLLTQQLLKQYLSTYRSIGESRAHLFPSVTSLLAQLQSAGIQIVIISNKLHSALKSAVKYFQIKNYIALTIGIQAEALCKPDPLVYKRYIQPIFPSISTAQMLMVGDTAVDLTFAQNLHIDACWARYGHGETAVCEALKPRYIIDQLSELEAILKV